MTNKMFDLYHPNLIVWELNLYLFERKKMIFEQIQDASGDPNETCNAKLLFKQATFVCL